MTTTLPGDPVREVGDPPPTALQDIPEDKDDHDNIIDDGDAAPLLPPLGGGAVANNVVDATPGR